jgi:hypothetical protein
MREIRQSGSEGGGAMRSLYPYLYSTCNRHFSRRKDLNDTVERLMLYSTYNRHFSGRRIYLCGTVECLNPVPIEPV